MKTTDSNIVKPIDDNVWLTSIIDLTEHKDYVPLTLAFLKKLNSIPGIKSSSIYEVCGFEDSEETENLILKDVSNILSKPTPFYEKISLHPSELTEKLETHALQDRDFLQSVFPVESNSAVHRILVIDSFNIRYENWTHILSSLRIYSNLLNIIDEKDRDLLTGLLNRHTFDNNLENIINHSKLQSRQARGDDETSWIAILDIDHFKRVNDTHGHIIGDEVLLLFSRLTLNTFRYSDIVFRFGGEEFVVVLTGCDREGAEKALNRFRAAVENYLFPMVGKVTVSAGYVKLDCTELPNIMLDHADQALYHAKETGRNKVVSYEEFSETLDMLDELGDVELF